MLLIKHLLWCIIVIMSSQSVFCVMENNIDNLFVLVPEFALIKSLEPQYQKRFEKALDLMHNNLAEKFSWEQIAAKSHISPYHFHRQFTSVFNETPGHYLSRVRLQTAVSKIMSEERQKITDIAYDCGFCSSQALAKVLQREFQMSAKSLRKFISTATPEQIRKLLSKVAHPANNASMEKNLAEQIPVEVIWYPKRGLKIVEFLEFDWGIAYDRYGERATDFLVSVQISELDKKWGKIKYKVGNWRADKKELTEFIDESYFLCCEVSLSSDAAYIEAIARLFEYAEQQSYEVDESAHLIEILRNIDPSSSGLASFSFQLPILM